MRCQSAVEQAILYQLRTKYGRIDAAEKNTSDSRSAQCIELIDQSVNQINEQLIDYLQCANGLGIHNEHDKSLKY